MTTMNRQDFNRLFARLRGRRARMRLMTWHEVEIPRTRRRIQCGYPRRDGRGIVVRCRWPHGTFRGNRIVAVQLMISDSNIRTQIIDPVTAYSHDCFMVTWRITPEE